MQSSPSPTSIIASINQSNYLCSQTPDPQTSTSQATNKDHTGLFQYPGKLITQGDKPPQFKQVYIVQEEANSSIATQNISDSLSSQTNYDTVNRQQEILYHITELNEPIAKQDKYNFKNLAINNYHQKYSHAEEILYQSRKVTRNEICAQQVIKVRPYSDEKLKLYLSNLSGNALGMEDVHTHSEILQRFLPSNLSHPYENESNQETVTTAPGESSARLCITINTKKSYVHNSDSENTSNECVYPKDHKNKDD